MVKHCEDIELKTKFLSMLLVNTGKLINNQSINQSIDLWLLITSLASSNFAGRLIHYYSKHSNHVVLTLYLLFYEVLMTSIYDFKRTLADVQTFNFFAGYLELTISASLIVS
jgi:uncharacterized membrane protein YoaK (UPF0700 family)